MTTPIDRGDVRDLYFESLHGRVLCILCDDEGVHACKGGSYTWPGPIGEPLEMTLFPGTVDAAMFGSRHDSVRRSERIRAWFQQRHGAAP